MNEPVEVGGGVGRTLSFVTPGLDPGVHTELPRARRRPWIASSLSLLAMTRRVVSLTIRHAAHARQVGMDPRVKPAGDDQIKFYPVKICFSATVELALSR